jgi:hypothetical protein
VTPLPEPCRRDPIWRNFLRCSPTYREYRRPSERWLEFRDIGYMLAFLGRAKGHDHQAACGPSRLGAYVVRLCAFANWRSCRWRDRTRGHRSPLVQRTSLLSLRLGMASSPLRGLVYTVRLWSLIATRATARRGSQAPHWPRTAKSGEWRSLYAPEPIDLARVDLLEIEHILRRHRLTAPGPPPDTKM